MFITVRVPSLARSVMVPAARSIRTTSPFMYTGASPVREGVKTLTSSAASGAAKDSPSTAMRIGS